VDVSQIRKHAERQAKLSSRIQTMELQKAATREVEGPWKGLFKKGVGPAAPPGPREDQYVYTEWLEAANSLLTKSADSYFKAGGHLEEDLNGSRDIKHSVTALVGGGTENDYIGGAGAFLAICMKHAALQRMAVDPKGKAKMTG